jgi:hypothetical protein
MEEAYLEQGYDAKVTAYWKAMVSFVIHGNVTVGPVALRYNTSSGFGWMVLFPDKEDICRHNEQSIIFNDLTVEKQVTKY